MYYCRVVNTTPSKPTSFASIVTRKETPMDDPNGVWQKDRGGKFNNFLTVELEVQNLQGQSIPLDFYIELECNLHMVMENGEMGVVLDHVDRNSKRLMNKHLEGENGKLTVIDVDPISGLGLRVGGPSRTSVRVRINELSKKGNRNSRFAVRFLVKGQGSLIIIPEAPHLSSSQPLTIYSKVVKSNNPTTSDTTPEAATAEEEEVVSIKNSDAKKTNSETGTSYFPFTTGKALVGIRFRKVFLLSHFKG
jgi:hypothetical protein